MILGMLAKSWIRRENILYLLSLSLILEALFGLLSLSGNVSPKSSLNAVNFPLEMSCSSYTGSDFPLSYPYE